MIQKLLLLIFVLVINFSVNAQYCPTNTITTDPNNYQNSSDPNQLQKWDWMQSTFMGWKNAIPVPVQYQFASPFYDISGNQNLNQLSFPQIKNYKPEDGWELVYRNFGSTSQGIDHPSFMLYNRYTGTLRVFMQINSTTSTYQSAQLIITPIQGSGILYSNGMLNSIGTRTIELTKINKNLYFEAQNYYSNSGSGSGFNPYWLYADFNVLYDPCICRFNSGLSVQAKLFQQWDVKLQINGVLQTNIVLQQTNGNSVVNADKGFGVFGRGVGTALNTISDVKKFIEVGGTIEQIANEWGRASDLFSLNQAIQKWFTGTYVPDVSLQNILKTGTSVLGGVNKLFIAVNTMSAIFDKKNQSTSPPSIRTVGFAESKLTATATGTISFGGTFGNSNFVTPGSAAAGNSNSPFLQPVYNNPMGVFNIVRKPKIQYIAYKPYSRWQNEDPNLQYQCSVEPDCPIRPTASQYLLNFRVSEPLQYVFNPSSNLRIVSIKTAISFSINKYQMPTYFGNMVPGDPVACDANSDSPSWLEVTEKRLNNIGFNLISGATSKKYVDAVISTQYVPASCIQKLNFLVSSSNGVAPLMSLKISLVMEPITSLPGSTVDKIVQTYTYEYTPQELEGFFSSGTDPYGYSDQYVYNDAFVSYDYTWPPYANIPEIACYTNNSPITNESIFFNQWNPSPFVMAGSFAGIPAHLWLENMNVNSDQTSLGNIILNAGVTFGSNPITIYYLGDIINNANIQIPSNVTFIKSLPDACGAQTLNPVEITTFCNSTEYENLVKLKRSPVDQPILSIPNQQSQNEDINEVTVSPNPSHSNSVIVIDTRKITRVKVAIYDMNGQLIKQLYANSALPLGRTTFNLYTSDLKNGVYFIKVHSDSGVISKRVVVVH